MSPVTTMPVRQHALTAAESATGSRTSCQASLQSARATDSHVQVIPLWAAPWSVAAPSPATV
ncbi:hypothetical protein [Kitasatospora aureofaciens]|uniref:hypothetical protein n=1 Tax=Kitasatospora aureofaciens TaxID=1894 RepID=UPI00131BE9BC|nr:hypothetical protein [Kitasatospora aureofaciens]